jgi:hypothetical protein
MTLRTLKTILIFGMGTSLREAPEAPPVFRDGRRFRYPRYERSEAADDQARVRSHLPRRRSNPYRPGHSAPQECTTIGPTTSLGCLTTGEVGPRAGSAAAMGDLDRYGYATRPTECRHLDHETDNTPTGRTSRTAPLVMLDPPVGAADYAKQIYYVPLAFKDRMVYRRDLCAQLATLCPGVAPDPQGRCCPDRAETAGTGRSSPPHKPAAGSPPVDSQVPNRKGQADNAS